MKKKYNFIKTIDSESAEILRQSNFTELTESGSKYFCFLNDGIINFTEKEIDKTKLNYTNTLCI